MKTVLKFIYKKPVALFIYIFYKVKWMDNGEHMTGYFLVKRVWVWLLLLPLIIVTSFFFGLYVAYNWLTNYDMHCVSAKNERLTFIQKLYLGTRLY